MMKRGVPSMPQYITLANWTEQGIKNLKDAPRRIDAANGIAAGFGGKLDAFYFTMGKYDLIFVTSFPNDEGAAKFLYSLGRLGNIRTHTLKAFTQADGLSLINSLQ
jgi:uncharacterized protein with GYD domain